MLEHRNKSSDGSIPMATSSVPTTALRVTRIQKTGPMKKKNEKKEKEEKEVKYWSSVYGVRTAKQHRDPGMFLRRHQNENILLVVSYQCCEIPVPSEVTKWSIFHAASENSWVKNSSSSQS